MYHQSLPIGRLSAPVSGKKFEKARAVAANNAPMLNKYVEEAYQSHLIRMDQIDEVGQRNPEKAFQILADTGMCARASVCRLCLLFCAAIVVCRYAMNVRVVLCRLAGEWDKVYKLAETQGGDAVQHWAAMNARQLVKTNQFVDALNVCFRFTRWMCVYVLCVCVLCVYIYLCVSLLHPFYCVFRSCFSFVGVLHDFTQVRLFCSGSHVPLFRSAARPHNKQRRIYESQVLVKHGVSSDRAHMGMYKRITQEVLASSEEKVEFKEEIHLPGGTMALREMLYKLVEELSQKEPNGDMCVKPI